MARRKDDPRDVYLVIHGHFYQPPRENPWLEAVEREPGAAPFPNWNARIADECYKRNGWARIFDDEGRVLDIVNNYTNFSFNMGPTLLSWLEDHMPRVYDRVLQADRRSVALRSGHGNALAQAYGHAILPLCNDRDRLTQIRWGKRDFAHRFGREPESLWLPETAVDAATVEDLITEGMSYLILSPRQASKVRRLGEGDAAWTDVTGDRIDPRMPYRCHSRARAGKYIDVFFYDGPVAHSISFEKVLHSSKDFVDKLWGAVDAGRDRPQLIHAAVDGETFGHHMRHAERALSFTFEVEAPARGFKLTNYGEYLEQNPPTHEVELAFGPGGEGTSWSCAHGVGRWNRDCGCNAGCPGDWDQAWRDPLRRAVNLVRDEAAALFEEMGGELLTDPWAARDDYVDILLDPSHEARERFLGRHGRAAKGVAQQVRILKLMEMQRFSLLSHTSCGWFFDDISGLEAVQILKYAARTVQVHEELSGRNVEQKLLEILGEARSNISDQGSGADIYRNRVLDSSISPHRLVAQYAITDLFHDYDDDHRYFAFQIHRVESREMSSGPVTMNIGRLQVELLRTGEASDITYALIHFGGHDFHCAVRPFAGVQEFRRFTELLDDIFDHATITELLRVVDAHFGETYYGLQHLLAEEREGVLDALFGHLTERFAEMYSRLYRDNHRAVGALIDTGLKVPREFRMAAEYVLSRQLNEAVRSKRGSKDPLSYAEALEVAREARRHGYELDQAESEEIFAEMITDGVKSLTQQMTEEACREVVQLFELADSLEVALSLGLAQEILFEMLNQQGGDRPWREFEPCFRDLLERMILSSRLAPA